MDAFCNYSQNSSQQPQQQQYQQQQQQQQQQYAQPPGPPPQSVQQPPIELQPQPQKPFLSRGRKLFALDANRLNPGKDFRLNLQQKTYVSNENDRASDPLFSGLDIAHLKSKPTYARFLALLDNFTAEDGVAETITDARLREEKAFIDEIYKTGPIQYLHKYLIAKKLVSSDPSQFKDQLHSIWFELYKRVVKNDSSAFEHAFVGEKAGRADYRGFILPKSKQGRGAKPTGNEHVLGFQLEWNGHLKPISTFLIGVSPEYELALYTLVFLAGEDGVPVSIDIDTIECEVVVHQFTNRSGQRIGSAYVSMV
ncbi:hypothetical protein BCR33DRAFT_722007 [Rhizoclosmatium globosum]|uniref:EndoU domain-containing protein n=1 Tax=Rhizoclosmatium globosum TaxID=329046 RepID=A0A1Y2BP18_9FUNG|nr:hypothetical protein BCR33DRAFT_722007 [Rhizoclosmatium globosum]|eukprot:ORY36488.1 hypothetical protein BCR33DRAFT_722007 [Rhizoclosmatium globosum]